MSSLPIKIAVIALLIDLGVCGGQAVNATRDVHLSVHVSSVYGDPAGGLEKRQFHITASGGELPFTLTGAKAAGTKAAACAMETHLLLVLHTSLQGSDVRDLPAALRPLFAAGWRVGAIDDGGTEIAEVGTEAELSAALTRPSRPSNSPFPVLDALRSGSGRRVVFLMAGAPSPLESAILRACQVADAMVYRVGGDPRRQHWIGESPDSEFTEFNGDGTATIASVAIPGVQQSHRYLRLGDPIEEARLADAAREALLDGSGYYDLKVQVPESVRALRLKVDLFDTSRGRYLVTVVPYAEGSSPPAVTIAPRL